MAFRGEARNLYVILSELFKILFLGVEKFEDVDVSEYRKGKPHGCRTIYKAS